MPIIKGFGDGEILLQGLGLEGGNAETVETASGFITSVAKVFSIARQFFNSFGLSVNVLASIGKVKSASISLSANIFAVRVPKTVTTNPGFYVLPKVQKLSWKQDRILVSLPVAQLTNQFQIVPLQVVSPAIEYIETKIPVVLVKNDFFDIITIVAQNRTESNVNFVNIYEDKDLFIPELIAAISPITRNVKILPRNLLRISKIDKEFEVVRK